MARLRKNDTGVNIGSTAPGAAPARRKAAPAPRKRVLAKPAAEATKSEPSELDAVVEIFSQPAVELSAELVVSDVAQTAIIEYLPSRQDIAALAYSYWVKRGYAEGCPEQDWLRAEAELRRRALATA